MSNRVFISHSSLDYRDGATGEIIPENAITRVMEAFRKNGIDFWVDEKDMMSGTGWPEQILPAIDASDVFLFISSVHSNASENTANEVQCALEKGKRIIPLRLDNSDYHVGVRLNLIRTHFLRYYIDPDRAIEKLILAVKSGNEIQDEGVTLLPDKADAQSGSKLPEMVLSVFNSADIKESVNSLSILIDGLECSKDKGYDCLIQFVNQLKKASEERNYKVRQSRIELLIAKIKDDETKMTRRVLVVRTLLLMFLYYSIGDIQEAIDIQKGVKEVVFKKTFFEQNAQTINDVTNVVARGAMFVGGIAGLLMGKGGSFSKSMTMASTRGEKIKVVSSPEEVEWNQAAFEHFKSVVGRLRLGN